MDNLIEKASIYAIAKHSNQKRKDGTLYIFHPFEVVTIASTMTNDEEVLAAAVLHDTVEDANVKIEEIEKIFGERIAKLVEHETEEEYPNLTKEESWIIRKKNALKKLETVTDINFKIIYLSDKLSNIRSLYRDYNEHGILAFNTFNVKDINVQAWYYYEVLDHLKELEKFEAYKEYKNKIDYIFEKTKGKDNEKNSYSI